MELSVDDESELHLWKYELQIRHADLKPLRNIHKKEIN